MTLSSSKGKQTVGKQSLAAASNCIPQNEATISLLAVYYVLTRNGAKMSWQCSFSLNMSYWRELTNRNLQMQITFSTIFTLTYLKLISL
jgi:hypothetical protein